MLVLDVDSLTVRYRDFTLGPINLHVQAGEFVSLIGPNGSGKSTLIRSLLGLNPSATAKSASVLEAPAFTRPKATFSRVSYVTDSPRDVLAEFTAHEYWNYCRLAYEAALGSRIDQWEQRAEEYSRALDFPASPKRPISAMSLGTARKAQIIAALPPSPELLVLDEPFIGLDFIASRAFEALLLELGSQGITVLASSHDLDLAARVANRIVVLYNGQIIVDDTISNLELGVEATVSNALQRARSAEQVS